MEETYLDPLTQNRVIFVLGSKPLNKIMKKRFFETFDIEAMLGHSLRLRDIKTGETVFIHRHAFNSLDNAVDFRVVTREFSRKCETNKWVEVLVWKVL